MIQNKLKSIIDKSNQINQINQIKRQQMENNNKKKKNFVLFLLFAYSFLQKEKHIRNDAKQMTKCKYNFLCFHWNCDDAIYLFAFKSFNGFRVMCPLFLLNYSWNFGKWVSFIGHCSVNPSTWDFHDYVQFT